MAMEDLVKLEVVVPLSQIAGLLLLCTVAVLWGKYRAALVIVYLFLYFWFYISIDSPGFVTTYDILDFKAAALYYGFGFVVALLMVIGLLRCDG